MEQKCNWSIGKDSGGGRGGCVYLPCKTGAQNEQPSIKPNFVEFSVIPVKN